MQASELERLLEDLRRIANGIGGIHELAISVTRADGVGVSHFNMPVPQRAVAVAEKASNAAEWLLDEEEQSAVAYLKHAILIAEHDGEKLGQLSVPALRGLLGLITRRAGKS